MNSKEINSLKWYSGGDYGTLNDALREGTRLSKEVQSHWDNIQSAFSKAPLSTEPITVYRGKKSDTIRKIVTPLSTSKIVKGTVDFVGTKCCLLIIDVVAGTNYIDISKISDVPSENEILLPPNGTLVYTGIEGETETETVIKGRKVRSLRLTYLPPQRAEIAISKIAKNVTEEEMKISLDISGLVNLIEEDEYELYDNITDIETTLKMSAPHSNHESITAAADIIWKKINLEKVV
jgi:hypothetical protein